MHLTRTVRIQLAIFTVIAITSVTVMFFNYMRIPTDFLGFNRYTVTMRLPAAGGLYRNGNVTYNGVEVGRVRDVRLVPGGVEAELELRTGVTIPADLEAEVHSVSAIGEQYVQLRPRSGDGPVLEDGDVIPEDRVSIPPDINALVDATNRGLKAIPQEDLQTVIDESYTAVGGLGPELSRLINGSTRLAVDARNTLDEQIALIERSKPLLDSQIETSNSIQAWAANMAEVTAQLRDNDTSVRGVLDDAPGAAEEVRALFDRVQPTLPVVLANLVSVNEVAVAYRPSLEAVLVLIPRGVEIFQGPSVANYKNNKGKGAFLAFNLNLNIPRPCTTGYLPPQQQRSPAWQDWPDRPEDDLYCRIPQDAPFNVRGARNFPCVTKPGKRAPTAAMCESDEEYVPLNDGWNWKGDPNATLSGQDIPQPPPGAKKPTPPSAEAPAPEPAEAQAPPIAVAEYDPATGSYVGPDGKTYTQSNLATPREEKTWQQMLLPPN